MNYMQQPMPNPEDISDPATAIDMALVVMAKAFKLNDTSPSNNNQRSSSNPSNRQIAQPGMNMGQDRQMLMVEDNEGNQNRLSVVQGIANQNGNGNVVAARAEGNGNGNNETQIRCYNCQGVGAYKEIEEVNANCTLKDNLQQASKSAYNDMQQKIEWLQAQLGDLKGKGSNTQCASDILDLLTQKLNDENVSLEINPINNSREDKYVPNKHVKASVRTKPSIVSQPHVITMKAVNSKKQNYTSSACNNIKLAFRNDKSEVVYAMCKQCLITANHDVCVLNYVNGMNYSKKNQSDNASGSVNQMKHKAHIKKSKKLGFEERLASPRPSKPRTCLRWLLTGRIFDLYGKITASSNTESESDTSVCDNASASNPQEPTSKRFPNSTSFLDRFTILWRQNTCLYPLDVL
ncbi:hypothetical protein Tco_1403560 [Tanacetum coccineum]